MSQIKKYFNIDNSNLTVILKNTSNGILYCNENSSICVNQFGENIDFVMTSTIQSLFENQNQENKMNDYFQFKNIISWCTLVVIIIGLFGNLISFIVLINPKMRISTNIFLSSLCISGFMALIGLLLNSFVLQLVSFYEIDFFYKISCFIYPYIYPLITTFQTASIMLTVSVSLNQFIYIFFNKTNKNSKKIVEKECRTAIVIVLVIFIFSIIYNIPYWLKFKYSKDGCYESTTINQDPSFNRIVHFWMYLPIVYIIPFSILIITNFYLVVFLVKTKRRRSRLGLGSIALSANENNRNDEKSNSKMELPEQDSKQFEKMKNSTLTIGPEDNSLKINSKRKKMNTNVGGSNVTIMLIAIVFFFFICQFPNLLLHIVQTMKCSTQDYCNQKNFFLYGIEVAKFLLISNLSFNFIIYCLFSKKFREVIIEIFPIFKKKYPKKNILNNGQQCLLSENKKISVNNV